MPPQNTKLTKTESTKKPYHNKNDLTELKPSAIVTYTFVHNVVVSSSCKIKEKGMGWEGVEKLISEHSCV